MIFFKLLYASVPPCDIKILLKFFFFLFKIEVSKKLLGYANHLGPLKFFLSQSNGLIIIEFLILIFEFSKII